MLFHCKIAFFLPSVWSGTEYTLALIWIKKLLIYFESYQGISYSHTSRVDRNVITLLYLQVANSANTNCRPFQVNFNCSKFIADELQQRCHMTLLFSLFVTSRNLLFAVFLSRKSIIILRKITRNSRQVPLKGVLLWIRVLECSTKILTKKKKTLPLPHMNFFISGF